MSKKHEDFYGDYIELLTLILSMHEFVENSTSILPYHINFCIQKGYRLVEKFREIDNE